ncbi:MAG: hypothetical protein MZV64_28160 [Ignavibacteriales bacterium]|nr:hypothetical protein [Ignavibacteriales bacterium]
MSIRTRASNDLTEPSSAVALTVTVPRGVSAPAAPSISNVSRPVRPRAATDWPGRNCSGSTPMPIEVASGGCARSSRR